MDLKLSDRLYCCVKDLYVPELIKVSEYNSK